MDKLLDLLKRPLLAIEDGALRSLVVLAINGKDEAFTPKVLSQSGDLAGLLGSSGKSLIIPIEGVLTNSDSWYGTTYAGIQEALDRASQDDIAQVILAIDSPGGEVTGLPETAAMLAGVAKMKPVTAIVMGTAASAAYWLASQARNIVVTPSGEVGSVGVRATHIEVSKMLEDAGVKVTEMHAGKYKTEFSPFTPLSQDSKDYMQATLDETHAQFIGAVSAGRGARATADIISARYGEGRMFQASEAVANGMADSIKSTRDFYNSLVQSTPGTVRTEDSGVSRARVEVERAKLQ